MKQPSPHFDWRAEITTLEQHLLRKSWNWPASHLKLVFPDHHKRIPHPRTSSEKNFRARFIATLGR
ncbi:hypothetical protein KO499_18835 [Marinobacter sp. F3R08]|nr:hypothetical protein [Marinobacter sp. F3R08]